MTGRSLVLPSCLQGGQDAEPVQFRHHDVEQHQVVVRRPDGRQRLHAVRRLIGLADAQPIEPADQQFAIFRDVVDDEEPGARIAHALALIIAPAGTDCVAEADGVAR